MHTVGINKLPISIKLQSNMQLNAIAAIFQTCRTLNALQGADIPIVLMRDVCVCRLSLGTGTHQRLHGT
jgi:hypothetical protein